LFVYVVKDDRTVTLRDVKTGPTEADATVIETGVEPGELIVVDGMDRLREGAKVDLAAADKGAGRKGGDGERRKGGGNRRKDGDAAGKSAEPVAAQSAVEAAPASPGAEPERKKGGGNRRKGGDKAAE